MGLVEKIETPDGPPTAASRVGGDAIKDGSSPWMTEKSAGYLLRRVATPLRDGVSDLLDLLIGIMTVNHQ